MKLLKPLAAVPALRDSQRELEIAFLPAALEIIETPPSPIGRAISLTIAALFCVALAWACWGKVDIVASAEGKIVPSGRLKVIQPFETSIVRAIHVQDGQQVRAGQVLVELDPTTSEAEREHVENDLIAAQLDAARLKAELAAGDPFAAFQPPQAASPDQVAMTRQSLTSELEEQRAKVATLDREASEKQADRDSIAATLTKINATIPMLQDELNVRQILYQKGLGSKLNYLETLETLTEHQKDLGVEQAHLREAQAALAGIVETRAETVAEFRSKAASDLAKAEQQAAGYGQDLIKAQQRRELQALTAPVDGIVQQLAVHTVGGVVTPAEALLAVVPADNRLEIEAMVPNRDVGFVHAGQEAEIKVHTFTFTRYGLLHGKVLTVSADAVTPQQTKEKTDPTQSDDEAAAEHDPVYAARISLDRTAMQIDDRLVELSPGMAVTVEIKTGSRRVISYLLSPLARYGQSALRER